MLVTNSRLAGSRLQLRPVSSDGGREVTVVAGPQHVDGLLARIEPDELAVLWNIDE